MRRGKRGRGMVNAKRSRIRDRKTIDSTLAIVFSGMLLARMNVGVTFNFYRYTSTISGGSSRSPVNSKLPVKCMRFNYITTDIIQ